MQKPINHSPIYSSANQMPAEVARRLLTGRNNQTPSSRPSHRPMSNDQLLLMIMSLPPRHLLHVCAYMSCNTTDIA